VNGEGSPGLSTRALIAAAQSGDEQALNDLLARYVPRLQRWARGRLPSYARGLADTNDLIQEAVLGTIRRLPELGLNEEGALQAYLRSAILNRIKSEIRRSSRAPSEPLDSALPAQDSSPLEAAIGAQAVERYEQALARLRDADRQAIIGRMELRLSFQELAESLGKPNAHAARMFCSRAIVRLAEEMTRER
jgi:RNA polymerase sigma-70 factor (ECF subfamily)